MFSFQVPGWLTIYITAVSEQKTDNEDISGKWLDWLGSKRTNENQLDNYTDLELGDKKLCKSSLRGSQICVIIQYCQLSGRADRWCSHPKHWLDSLNHLGGWPKAWTDKGTAQEDGLNTGKNKELASVQALQAEPAVKETINKDRKLLKSLLKSSCLKIRCVTVSAPHTSLIPEQDVSGKRLETRVAAYLLSVRK